MSGGWGTPDVLGLHVGVPQEQSMAVVLPSEATPSTETTTYFWVSDKSGVIGRVQQSNLSGEQGVPHRNDCRRLNDFEGHASRPRDCTSTIYGCHI